MTHASRTLGRLLALSLLALPAVAPAQTGDEADEVVATHGDWDIRCNAGRDVCVMHQVGKGQSGNNVLEVRIRRLEGVTAQNGQAIPAAIQIAAPLGVLLQQGVRVAVDGGTASAFPFQICVQGGCLSRDAIPVALLDRMKAGRVARFTVASPQGEVPVDLSLTGFTKAFNSLQP